MSIATRVSWFPLRVLSVVIVAASLFGAAPPPAVSSGGMVAADEQRASEAGAAMLAAGGNAVDAAVATALACGVVQPSSSGLGGGGFAVIVLPDGSQQVLDFREVAPKAATAGMFVDASASDASRRGGLAVAVPGELAGLIDLHAAHGQLPLKSVIAPARRLARGGFPVGAHLAESLRKAEERGVPMAKTLFDEDTAPQRGDTVRNTALASTLAAIGRGGADTLRRGPVAQALVDTVQSAGGIITLEDLQQYEPRSREPVVGSYRGWRVVTMPPPSSGGVVLLQVLGVLEAMDVASLGHNSADHVHLLAEAFQHAFADRAAYMGDPDRVEVPVRDLLSVERIQAIQRQILPSRTFERDHYGTRIDIGRDAGTQHISVIDKDGMAVALTTTINTSFGSQLVVEGRGIVLNNEMDDFVARPGEPNAYGLVGSAANAVHPGSRPLSSMSPTVLVSPDGLTQIVVGASGGPWIISSTLQVISNIVDFGLDPSEAVARPRMHHQWVPEKLFLDEGYSVDTHRALQARGHVIAEMPFFSSVQVVVRTPDGVEGASDPRKGGWPAGD